MYMNRKSAYFLIGAVGFLAASILSFSGVMFDSVDLSSIMGYIWVVLAIACGCVFFMSFRKKKRA